MITQSFIFLPGIGYKKEKELWQLGIVNWDIFLKTKIIKSISKKRKIFYDVFIKKAKNALINNDINF